MNNRASHIFLILVLCGWFACKNTPPPSIPPSVPFLTANPEWADSLLKKMSIEEKVGQLIFVKLALTSKNWQDSLQLGRQRVPSGAVAITELQSNQVVYLRDSLNLHFKTPLLIGSANHLYLQNSFTDAPRFPSVHSISSNTNPLLRETLKSNTAYLFKRSGFHFSTGLTIDASNTITPTQNWKNELTSNDSSQLNHQLALLDTLQKLKVLSFGQQLSSVKDSIQNHWTKTFSSAKISGWNINDSLIKESVLVKQHLDSVYRYNGLLISSSKSNIASALLSGVDVFLSDQPSQVFQELLKAFKKGILTRNSLDTKVKKVLLAKTYVGLGQEVKSSISKLPINLDEFAVEDNLADYLNSPKSIVTQKLLYEHSISLLRNQNNLIPLKINQHKKIAFLSVGEKPVVDFISTLRKYQTTKVFKSTLPNAEKLKPYKTVILVINELELDTSIQKYKAIYQLSQELASKLIVVNFGHPGHLKLFDKAAAVIQTAESNIYTHSSVAEGIVGAIAINGQPDISSAKTFNIKEKLSSSITRLKFVSPEEVNIHPDSLRKIDSLVYEAISLRAIPGCQVLAIKDGKVFLNKSYGYQSNEKRIRVRNHHLYDIASITKVAATTLSLMKLNQSGKVNLQDSLSTYYPKMNKGYRNHPKDFLGKSTLRNVKISDLLTHQSGLQSWMPIGGFISYKDSIHRRFDKFFCWDDQQQYKVKVANNFHLDKDYLDSLWVLLNKLPVDSNKTYKYSDVNFQLLHRLIEKVSGKKINRYLQQKVLNPLGLKRTCFLPLKKYTPEQIVPTAEDFAWRGQLLRGFVHDESAALMGGIAGNAGLFSNATDLAVLFQMLLNNGSYGGKKIFFNKTVSKFINHAPGSHRGLGFNKPFSSGKTPACSRYASASTFGHTGFTGCCVWADPKNGLTYIFLSNRIHPRPTNKTIYALQTRRKIHDVLYRIQGSLKSNPLTPPNDLIAVN